MRQGLVQTVSCAGCGAIFAGCVEPHCYEDKDWQKDIRDFVKRGFKIAMSETCRFGTCTCEKPKEVINQTNLFP